MLPDTDMFVTVSDDALAVVFITLQSLVKIMLVRVVRPALMIGKNVPLAPLIVTSFSVNVPAYRISPAVEGMIASANVFLVGRGTCPSVPN